jgi:hypothetical protein
MIIVMILNSFDIVVRNGKAVETRDTTGHRALINQFDVQATICCDRCRTCDQSSTEAACDNEWTAQEFYYDGWRYYKDSTYCSRCMELITIKYK